MKSNSIKTIFWSWMWIGYKTAVRPFLTGCCRFDPECSVYAREALSRYSLRYGVYLTARRLLRCHPWGGDALYDPVPSRKKGAHHG
jgi:putative membrane protein insertion efficiency factor